MEQSPKEGVKGQQVVGWDSFLPIPFTVPFFSTRARTFAPPPPRGEEQRKVKDMMNAYTMQNLHKEGKEETAD